MLSNFLFKSTFQTIEMSLDAYSLRQQTLSNNIANAGTPDYQAQKVKFEDDLQHRLENRVKMTQSDQQHITVGKAHEEYSDPMITFKDSSKNDTGVNNVDVDKEMAEMSENNLRYEMSIKLVSRKINGLKKAIKGQGMG